jgi:hypothetical protein
MPAKTLLEAGFCECRFPIGEDEERGLIVCAETSQIGKPYCRAHMRLTYTPTPRMRREAKTRVEATGLTARRAWA